VIRHFGGLHRFMNWDGPILTDSGGYQIFSLAKLRKITEEGVAFQNHLDGTPTFISPESAMEIQATLGSDIAMVLDECPPWPCEYDYAARSLERTLRWAERCKRISDTGLRIPERKQAQAGSELSAIRNPQSQMVFGIVQGSTFEDLRRSSAQALAAMDFDGYAIGGVSVGEPEPEMMRAVEWSEPHLPRTTRVTPMGLGTAAIDRVDRARRGHVRRASRHAARAATNRFHGRRHALNLKNAEFTLQKDQWKKAVFVGVPQIYARLHPAFGQVRGDSWVAFAHDPQPAFLPRSHGRGPRCDRDGASLIPPEFVADIKHAADPRFGDQLSRLRRLNFSSRALRDSFESKSP
jgi:tRNA-guanine transglycosylase